MTRQITFWDAQVSVFRPCPQLGPISAWLVQKGEGAPTPGLLFHHPKSTQKQLSLWCHAGRTRCSGKGSGRGLVQKQLGHPPVPSHQGIFSLLMRPALWLICSAREMKGAEIGGHSLAFVLLFMFSHSHY